MAGISFVDNVTLVPASWLNAVDNLVYDICGTPATQAELRTTLSLYSTSEVDALIATLTAALADLSGVTDAATARTNLDVYSTAEVDAKGVVIDEMAFGNVMNPLVHLPLKHSLGILIGTGTTTFTRTTIATYVDRYGVLKTAAIDEPRFEKKGLLMEGDSTNLLLYSNDFSAGLWTQSSGITWTTGQTGPDEGSDAVLATGLQGFSISGSGTNLYYSGASVTAGNTYTFSIWIKRTSGTDVPYLRAKTNSSSTNFVESGEDHNEWQRVSLTFTVPSGDTTVDLVTGTSTSAINAIIWGGQLEELPFASSYITTTTATVHRDNDLLSVTYDQNIPTPSDPLTYFVDFDLLGSQPYARVVDLPDGRVFRAATSLGNVPYGYDGVNYIYSSAIDYNTIYRGALRFDPDNLEFSIWLNGIQQESGTYDPANATDQQTFNFGSNASGAGLNLYGHIANFRLYDILLSDNEMRTA